MSSGAPEPSPPEPPAQSRIGEGLREGRRLGQWFSSLRPEQVQSLALVFLTIFQCILVGWIIYRTDAAREKDKDREQAGRDAQTRECNTQFELNRQYYAGEREKDRMSLDRVAATLQGTQKEMLNQLLVHMTAERDKDRTHDLDRDREHLKTIKEIRDAWAAFAIRIGDLEKLLRTPKPEDMCVEELLKGPRSIIEQLPGNRPR